MPGSKFLNELLGVPKTADLRWDAVIFAVFLAAIIEVRILLIKKVVSLFIFIDFLELKKKKTLKSKNLNRMCEHVTSKF